MKLFAAISRHFIASLITFIRGNLEKKFNTVEKQQLPDSSSVLLQFCYWKHFVNCDILCILFFVGEKIHSVVHHSPSFTNYCYFLLIIILEAMVVFIFLSRCNGLSKYMYIYIFIFHIFITSLEKNMEPIDFWVPKTLIPKTWANHRNSCLQHPKRQREEQQHPRKRTTQSEAHKISELIFWATMGLLWLLLHLIYHFRACCIWL